jgi:hypothetical protein
MCTGIELALAAGAMGLSAGGGMIARNEANNDAARMMNAKNEELKQVLAREEAFQKDNYANFDKTLGNFAQPKQEAAVADATTQRQDAAVANMKAPDVAASEIPLGGNTPEIIKSSIAKSMSDAFSKTTQLARDRAKLGAYSDVWGGNDRNVTNTGLGVESNNAMSRSWASLLPSLQDFAAYAAHKPSSGLGETMQVIGNMMGGFAGRGFAPTTPRPSY